MKIRDLLRKKESLTGRYVVDYVRCHHMMLCQHLGGDHCKWTVSSLTRTYAPHNLKSDTGRFTLYPQRRVTARPRSPRPSPFQEHIILPKMLSSQGVSTYMG